MTGTRLQHNAGTAVFIDPSWGRSCLQILYRTLEINVETRECSQMFGDKFVIHARSRLKIYPHDTPKNNLVVNTPAHWEHLPRHVKDASQKVWNIRDSTLGNCLNQSRWKHSGRKSVIWIHYAPILCYRSLWNVYVTNLFQRKTRTGTNKMQV